MDYDQGTKLQLIYGLGLWYLQNTFSVFLELSTRLQLDLIKVSVQITD